MLLAGSQVYVGCTVSRSKKGTCWRIRTKLSRSIQGVIVRLLVEVSDSSAQGRGGESGANYLIVFSTQRVAEENHARDIH